MTRINLVPVVELTDQHLFSEFREIKMVPYFLSVSLEALERCTSHPQEHLLNKLPAVYTLNKGHVSFFYDKGLYLQQRYSDLTRELMRRGIAYNQNALLDKRNVFAALDQRFHKDYIPTPAALVIIRERIAQRIALQPAWYRYEGVPGGRYTLPASAVHTPALATPANGPAGV